ncbi:thioredoxin family protein [Nitrogeniibacter mangrovi]|uniref:Thioredoxin family protein n=1 Tax=Nitrogeniibacter mangrovi TaxID=2016596 RepID=A0A6C1B1R3_9RHOO|nr:thioredoxin family protein [Nitrogeniibacter mangrovi]QID16919.1 thioredoxin family protein [Nitrogeniibacter mangrovi]
MSQNYQPDAPDRARIDAMDGPVVLDFGTNWCGHCDRARPLVDALMAAHPGVRHLRIEDAAGRRLGRSFGVKHWPTLVFLCRGTEIARVVRPTTAEDLTAAMTALEAAG